MEGWQVLEQAAELRRRGVAFALATVVWRQGPSSGQQGSRAIITSAGEIRGWIGGACAEPAVVREARQVIAEGVPRLLLLGTPEQLDSTGMLGGRERFGAAVAEGRTVVPISCQSEGSLEVYVEPVLPVPHLVIVGRSPMAHTLADLATALDWHAEVIDRQDFTATDAGERSMVVVATQGHGDEEALERAAAARPAYLGLVGSSRRGAAVLGYLAERGVPAGQLSRVRVPAGLDLGRTSHREIAVAILAELVKLRAAGGLTASRTGRAGGAGVEAAGTEDAGAADAGTEDAGTEDAAVEAAGTKDAGTDTAGAADAGAAADAAVDPVCGMTVAADRSGYPLDYREVRYYFCRAQCRRQFEADPAAYARRETRC